MLLINSLITILLASLVTATLFPTDWEALGPFPHGTRELGDDPLSSYGGFENLQYSETEEYTSELADGGYVKWQRVQTSPDGIVGNLIYENIRWENLRYSFGWTAIQHSIYFRSTFSIVDEGTYLFQFDGPITFKIDNFAYPGNPFGYKHAAESSVYLTPGTHHIYICMVLDVRIHGGSTPPKLSFTGSIKRIIPDLNLGMIVYPNDTILPELMDDKLITEYGSITIKNGFLPLPLSQRPQIAKYDVNTERGWKQVIRVVAKDSSGQELRINSKTMYTIMLAPGQVFAVPFKFIGVPKNFDGTISLELLLYDNDQEEIFTISVGTFILNRHTWGVESYRITFDGFDNAIQEAIVKPPKIGCNDFEQKKCPVVVALHGAGVDINDNNFWTDAVNRQEYAWIIFATGRTPWGFDWHGPSYKNIDASIDALRFAPGVPESLKMDYLPQIERLIFVGHSNGGHGAWWCASHYPDRTLAVIPASGYTKIQLYVPYFLHLGFAYTDPIMRGIMESSISENDLDLYAANLGGIPILARSGGDDDNVPAYHTRRLFRMINEWNGKLNSIRYVEDPGKGHWYTGILNDNIATHFLNDIIHPNINPKLSLPKLPNPFTVATLNPASSGTRGGIRILQLEVPFKFATIKVHRIHNNHWELTTSNVRRFGFVKDSRQGDITTWSIDGTQFLTPPEEAGPSYLKTEEGWELASDLLWISRERNPTTYGPISLIFSEPFRIVIPTAPTSDIYLYRKLARQIAQNWYIAGRGSTQIIKDIDVLDGISAKYNLIVLGDPRDNYYTLRRTQGGASKLISFTPNGGIKIGGNTFDQPGTGALFLAPSQARTRLCLFVTGVDESGLLRAAWSIPFQTGLQVADYLIVGNEYGDPSTGWTADGIVEGGTKGAGGILATGFWNNTWEFSSSSGYLK